jgi:hypothetical protein
MGLGKTAQVVAFLDHLYEIENIKGPFLICVPLSTIGHWKREIESWSNMRVCVYHDAGGGRDMRDIIREYEWYYKGRSRRLLKFHCLVTTYDDLVRDYEELAEVPWRVVIVDEAHRLKNVNSKLLDCTRTVTMKGQNAYGYQHRILMTGTPLQNNTMELWSLLNFIEPAKFPDLEKFQIRFGIIKTQEQVELLQRRIAPHLLRRVKEDVATDIPPKEETMIDVELTTIQKQYYRAIYEHNHSFLMQNTKGNVLKLMNIQMELRKCCNHPFLINGVEIKEMEDVELQLEEEAANSRTSSIIRTKLLFDQQEFEKRRMEQRLIPSSGKMVLLDKLLPKLLKEGHKVLIFSQMVKMIDLIEEYCEYRMYSCYRLDGRISGNDRQRAIDKFNHEINSFIFLLSTRAGGVGINLTAADIVIIFDSDWNPQNDIQAMARCHRIGQSKNVKIYRLITRRSFEQEMFDRASKKLGLEQAVLGTRNFQELEEELMQSTGSNEVILGSTKSTKLDAKEMEQLLREGAYAVLLEDDTETIKQFYEQDIDQILEQRAHVLVSETTNSTNHSTESWLNKRKLLSKTNKRLFTGDSAKEFAEIDVNDPDFWKKVLPDLVTPDTMFERLNDDSLLLIEDEEGNGPHHHQIPHRHMIDKFMKDLSQMMDGMLDLSRRNQLPDHERAICLKLLLRMTLQEDIFEEHERLQAQDWMSMIEGARSRRGRQDLYQVEDHRSSNSNSHHNHNSRAKAKASSNNNNSNNNNNNGNSFGQRSKIISKGQQSNNNNNAQKKSKRKFSALYDEEDDMDDNDNDDDDLEEEEENGIVVGDSAEEDYEEIISSNKKKGQGNNNNNNNSNNNNNNSTSKKKKTPTKKSNSSTSKSSSSKQRMMINDEDADDQDDFNDFQSWTNVHSLKKNKNNNDDDEEEEETMLGGGGGGSGTDKKKRK